MTWVTATHTVNLSPSLPEGTYRHFLWWLAREKDETATPLKMYRLKTGIHSCGPQNATKFCKSKWAYSDNLINGVFIQVCTTMNSVGPRPQPVIIAPFPRCIVEVDLLNGWQTLAPYLTEYGPLSWKAGLNGLAQNLLSLQQTPRETRDKSHQEKAGGSP